MSNDFREILANTKSIHFVGVGGIGLSRLAKWFLAEGKKVSGSDLLENEIIKSLISSGLVFYEGHSKENIPDDCDLIVRSEAIPKGNAEIVEASSRQILVLNHFDVLGALTKDRFTIAIAGTNGKSTTTAMVGSILEDAGFDPTVFLGSKMEKWQGNLRIGKSDIVIVEADELNRQFLRISPDIIVITNIENEHMDYYEDTEDLLSAFKNFADLLPQNGTVVYNADDLGVAEVASRILNKKKISYGRKAKDVILKKAFSRELKMVYSIKYKDADYEGELLIPGEYNVYNATAAIAGAIAAHVDPQIAVNSLSQFKGLWRRFERVGEYADKGTELISDYAHHPTALKQMMAAAREFYTGLKVVIFFQPHQRKRTKEFFSDFAKVLAESPLDEVVITEIFDVSGREDETVVSGRDLYVEVSKKRQSVEFISDAMKSLDKVKEIISHFDAALFVGAGDIYLVPIKLIAKN